MFRTLPLIFLLGCPLKGRQDQDGDGSPSSEDCDDLDPARAPTFEEQCDDGLDNDCDGVVDEADAVGGALAYLDQDGDGYGDTSQSESQCELASGWSRVGGDCADDDAAVHPVAEERCDGLDNNCDGAVDDGSSIDPSTWWEDGDGDGFGDASNSVQSCSAPSGWVGEATDCDDEAAQVYPGAAEVCGDGVVNTCEGSEASALEACGLSGSRTLSEAAQVIEGLQRSDALGFGASGLGDLDGDGWPDLGLGAYKWDGDDSATLGLGAVFVLSGADLASSGTTVSAGIARWTLVGTDVLDSVGYAVSTRWDRGSAGAPPDAVELLTTGVNPDSVTEGIGTVYVVSASALEAQAEGMLAITAVSVQLRGETAGDQLGRSVSGRGDLDGDGREDIVVGAHADSLGAKGTWAGAAYVVPRADLPAGVGSYGVVDVARYKLTGTSRSAFLGLSVAWVPDFDGDGVDDLVIGSPSYDPSDAVPNTGSVYFVSGARLAALSAGERVVDTVGVELVGEEPEGWLGRPVAGVEDTDGDGLGELLLGASLDAVPPDSELTLPGWVYLVPGRAGEWEGSYGIEEVGHCWEGAAHADYTGRGIAGAGDLDGDGLTDLLVGAPQINGAGGQGLTYGLYSSGALRDLPVLGSCATITSDVLWTGDNLSDFSGVWVSWAGDLDQDGLDDGLVSAPYRDTPSPGAGAVYVLRGGGY